MQQTKSETSDDLELPATSPEVKRYQRLKLTAGIVNTILSFGYVAILGLAFGVPLGGWLQSVTCGCRWLTLVGMTVLVGVGAELITFPLTFLSGFVLEHRFNLSRQNLAGWIWRRVKSYFVGGILGMLLILGLYALMWSAGDFWWAWAAIGYLLITVVLGRLVPILILPLFYKTTPLDDEELSTRLERLADGTGLTIDGVYRLHLSKETRKANAALTGLGRSRRVLLGDTLLDEFTPEEIEVVFAHEVGHHVYRHLPKSVALSVLTTTAGLWLVDRLLGYVAPALGYDSFSDPAALPLVLLVLSAFGLILSPLQNALSRFYERQCDRYALERTGDRLAYRSAFIKLARLNKSDPDPNPVIVALFYDHPPIRERVAMAET